MISKKETIAVFDFDGTITKKDSFIDFLLFSYGKLPFFKSLLMNSPVLILYFFRVIPNWKAKQKLFSYYFKGMKLEDFNTLCQNYLPRIDLILRDDAIQKINQYKSDNSKVVVVSASIENWIKPWADKYGIETISTLLETGKDNTLTGNFMSLNCYGQEKVNRFVEKYPEKKLYKLFAYGDSRGDKELLAFADHAYYKYFKK